MTALIKQLDKAKGWITFIVMIGAGGFTVAVTLASKASASSVEAVVKTQTEYESRLSAVEAHHADDDRLIDWLVQAMWSQRPDVPPPPTRRAH